MPVAAPIAVKSAHSQPEPAPSTTGLFAYLLLPPLFGRDAKAFVEGAGEITGVSKTRQSRYLGYRDGRIPQVALDHIKPDLIQQALVGGVRLVSQVTLQSAFITGIAAGHPIQTIVAGR